METTRKYYVVEIVTYNDSKKPAYGVYAYGDKVSEENLNDAMVAFHGKCRTNRADATCATSQVVVLDDYNKIAAEERFGRNPSEATP